MSLSLRIGSNYIELPPQTKIRLELQSPIFFEEDERSDYTFPFKIPPTPKNLTLLGFPASIDVLDEITTDIVATILDDDQDVITGSLVMTYAMDRDHIQAHLKAGIAELWKLYQRKCNSIEWGGRVLRNERKMFATAELSGMTGGTLKILINFQDTDGDAKSQLFSQFWSGTIPDTIDDMVDQINATTFNLVATRPSGNFIFIENLDPGGVDFYEHVFTVNFYDLVPPPGTWSNEEIEAGPEVLYKGLDDHMSAKLGGDSDRDEYVYFPVKNEGHSYGGGLTLSGNIRTVKHVNPFHVVDQEFKTITNYHIVADPDHICTNSPFPYVLSALKNIFSSIGFTLSGSWSTDAEIKTLVLFNTRGTEIQRPYIGFTVPPIPASWVIGILHDDYIDLKDHMPQATVLELLQSLKKSFCLGFFPNYKLRTFEAVPLKEILEEEDYNDITDKCEPDHKLTQENPTGFKFCHPADGADAYYGENVKDFDQSLLDPEAVTAVADLPTPVLDYLNTAFLVLEDNKIYLARWDDDDEVLGWYEYTDNMLCQEVGTDEAQREIDSGLSPLLMFKGEQEVLDSEVSDKWLIPICDMAGNMPNLFTPINPYGIRLLFYRGEYAGAGAAGDYPLGSHNVYEYDGTKVADYSLVWNQPTYGLYAVWWEKWAAFLMATREITKNVRLTALDIQTLDWKKKEMINGVKFLKKSITIELPIIKPAEMVLKKTT